MPIQRTYGVDETRIDRRSGEQDQVFRLGEHNNLELVYQKAELPTITSFTADRYFDARGATVGDLVLSWETIDATSRQITFSSGFPTHVIGPGVDSATIVAPTVDHEVMTLEASNAQGIVVAHIDYYRWYVSIDSFSGQGQQTPPFGNVTPTLSGNITMNPWMNPIISLTSQSGNLHGFSASAIMGRLAASGTATRSFFVRGNPAAAGASLSERFNLSVQLRINGANVGAPATRALSFSW